MPVARRHLHLWGTRQNVVRPIPGANGASFSQRTATDGWGEDVAGRKPSGLAEPDHPRRQQGGRPDSGRTPQLPHPDSVKRMRRCGWSGSSRARVAHPDGLVCPSRRPALLEAKQFLPPRKPSVRLALTRAVQSPHLSPTLNQHGVGRRSWDAVEALRVVMVGSDGLVTTISGRSLALRNFRRPGSRLFGPAWPLLTSHFFKMSTAGPL